MRVPFSPEKIREANSYLRKHQLSLSRILTPPRLDLGLIVVIPCYNEPNIGLVLDCLWHCKRPACGVEVIVLVNAVYADAPHVHAQNQWTVMFTKNWIAAHQDDSLQFHVLDFPGLPPRHAGVGLARKLGMDEAVARFTAAGNPDGIIACLDADCCCDGNYLTALVAHFRASLESPGCAVYFEHPLDSKTLYDSSIDLKITSCENNQIPSSINDDQLARRARAAIVGYELHLRYYVHGLRYAGSPYAFYTVGSCMAVRTRIYEKQGGMNRRKAGEDFYFLQKIIGLGNFTELRSTRVLPSPRISERVPFGTGRMIGNSLGRGEHVFYTYAPEVFRDLRLFLSRIGNLYDDEKVDSRFVTDYLTMDPAAAELSEYLPAFLTRQRFNERWAEIRRNAASSRTFRKRFHHWFNALLTLQFIHFATAHRYPKISVEQAAHRLLEWSGEKQNSVNHSNGNTSDQQETLLLRYRTIDREGVG
uniref:Glycosyltransferase like family 2 n=1 Tax=Candidatus Kentrum sp. TUN TaxID=2126343 RepID=A0A450ZUZ4_9GAMM|nr:MAG: Glycosyltransferase like family 2 [Candidatus Kentron sp. TUN]VFK65843.1 MAG: Glycosyltransferase like family 2 [Candidatus Kentron sp. TUN]